MRNDQRILLLKLASQSLRTAARMQRVA